MVLSFEDQSVRKLPGPKMNNGIGFVLLWQRGWKRDGLPPPQQQQMAAPAAVATPVVAATVVGAEAAAAPTQQA